MTGVVHLGDKKCKFFVAKNTQPCRYGVAFPIATEPLLLIFFS